LADSRSPGVSQKRRRVRPACPSMRTLELARLDVQERREDDPK
jgi:hypothetical protein